MQSTSHKRIMKVNEATQPIDVIYAQSMSRYLQCLRDPDLLSRSIYFSQIISPLWYHLWESA